MAEMGCETAGAFTRADDAASAARESQEVVARSDARSPNVRELHCVTRRLSPSEIATLVKVYGIHRTTVAAHAARAGTASRQLTAARVDEAGRL